MQVPVNPEYPNARRNYWKVDEHRITPKMLRRHFSGTRDILAGSSCRNPAGSESMETSPKCTGLPAVLEDKRSSKFHSSFSIESLLKKDPEVCVTSTLPTDAPVDVNLLRKACSLKNTFEWDASKAKDSFRDFSRSDIRTYSECPSLAYNAPCDLKRNRYKQATESRSQRARLSPPVVMYLAAGVSPFFNHEHMIALKRWSHGMATFDSRSF